MLVDALEWVVLDLLVTWFGLEGDWVKDVVCLDHVKLLVLDLRGFLELYVQRDVVHVVGVAGGHRGVGDLGVSELLLRFKIFEHKCIFILLLRKGDFLVVI